MAWDGAPGPRTRLPNIGTDPRERWKIVFCAAPVGLKVAYGRRVEGCPVASRPRPIEWRYFLWPYRPTLRPFRPQVLGCLEPVLH